MGLEIVKRQAMMAARDAEYSEGLKVEQRNGKHELQHCEVERGPTTSSKGSNKKVTSISLVLIPTHDSAAVL